MDTAERSVLDLLVAARRCEVAALEQLAQAVHLVAVVRSLAHGLQRERGASNLYLGSSGRRYGERLHQYRQDAEHAQAEFLEHLAAWLSPGSRGLQCSRLLGGIALAVDGLSRLPELRAAILRQDVDAPEVIERFTELLGHLLGVVFEAADTAVDPEVSRALVALFNLMQGKELSGQERAIGVAGFSRGWGDETLRQSLVHRIDAQERCFRIFTEFCDEDSLRLWQECQTVPHTAELERLRRIACTGPRDGLLEGSLDLAELWFAQATHRIDALWGVEEQLEAHLRGLCERRLSEVRAVLADATALMGGGEADSRGREQPSAVILGRPLPVVGEAGAARLIELERQRLEGNGGLLQTSLMDLVHVQSRQLHAIADELTAAREALAERKLIERAKSLLMKHRNLSEEQAYHLLRQTAMNQNRRLAEVAEATVAMADMLAS
ncbi:nitrate regulatory protein [Thioalkalivibrio paradoxus]|uniref:nitrate regulatory protein n=1 Tax=Thioalkalivibrio paradoxus TaxID=108010 RepID=UPI00022C5C78|nr:nitrate regulatory protein [Thioalkalivibrio paradoxus]